MDTSSKPANRQNPPEPAEDLPHPYLIVPPEVDSQHWSRFFEPGDEFIFELVLMGKAGSFCDSVQVAVREMAQAGFGAQRTAFEWRTCAGWTFRSATSDQWCAGGWMPY